MAITSSTVTVEGAQIDGRRWVREIHSDAQGVAQIVDYLGGSDAATTAQGIATARAGLLNVSLADKECVAKMAVDVSPLPLRWQSAAQFLDRLREVYRNGNGITLAQAARWITRRIDDGTVTVAQLRTAFGLTSQQWTTLETKMRALRSDIDAVDAGQGE